MADRRPDRGSGPRGSRRPSSSRRARLRSGAGDGSAARARGSSRPAGRDARPEARRTPERPRFTGRAAILVLVVAVLTVSFASSMRAYLQQQEHISDLHQQIAETEGDISQLQREKRRWQDDAYVEAQARSRFGYIMPGETGYMVIDENGNPLDSPDQLTDAGDLPEEEPDAWWEAAWASVEAAGHPGKGQPDTPVDKIKPPSSDD